MKKTNAILVYYLSRAGFLGMGFSLILSKSNKDTYIAALLGTLIGVIITSLFNYIIKNSNFKDLLKGKIGLVIKVLFIIICIYFIFLTLIIYKVFTTNFLLPNTPSLFLTIPFIILACFLAFKGMKIINRVASSFLPISLILIIFSFLGLLEHINLTRFLPILTVNTKTLFTTTIYFASISSIPNILTLNYQKNIKNYWLFYLIACLTLLLTIVTISGIYSKALIDTFRFPEYMVLKQFKILDFIEKIENIAASVWVLDIFFMCVSAINLLKDTFDSKYKKYIVSIILLIIIVLENFIFTDYTQILRIYYSLPYVLISFLIILIPLILKKVWHQ